jgi:hypothetical protein
VADTNNISIPESLYHLDSFFRREFEGAQDRIAILLNIKYREKVLAVDAYDTGAFHAGIDTLPARNEGEIRVVEVESDRYRDATVAARRPKGIGDIIERGRRPPVNYPGRFPGKLAVEEADPSIIQTLQDAARAAVNDINTA